MLVVRLVKEHVFPVAALCSPVFEDALLRYAMFSTKTLPKHGTHFEHLRSDISATVFPKQRWNPHFGCRIGPTAL